LTAQPSQKPSKIDKRVIKQHSNDVAKRIMTSEHLKHANLKAGAAHLPADILLLGSWSHPQIVSLESWSIFD